MLRSFNTYQPAGVTALSYLFFSSGLVLCVAVLWTYLANLFLLNVNIASQGHARFLRKSHQN